jgi:hypothetical protein
VKPYVEFAIEFAPLLKVVSKLFIDGLKLNRARYEERSGWLKMIESKKSNGKITAEKAAELTAKIQEIEDSLNFTFWDFGKTATKV